MLRKMCLKKIKNLDKYAKVTILVIILGILLRFALVVPYQIAGDACWHMSNAKFIAANNKIPLYESLSRDQPFWSPPMFHIIAAIFYKVFNIFGSSAAEFGIKLVSPLFGSLSLIFTYLIFRRLFDKKISLYGVIFIAFLPMSIDYSIFGYADSMLTFFVVASVYFALIDKTIMSGLSLALACLTKYTGLAAIPVILYIIFLKNKKTFLKKSMVTMIIAVVLSSPWYVRNWIYLKNPLYPILNSFFGGVEVGTTYSGLDFSKLFSINSIITPFLETFGVPDGNPSNFMFFNLPFLPILITVWLLAIFVFTIPIFFGLNIKKESRNIALTWFAPYLAAGILHILNVGWSIARRILPAYTSLAFFWGKGLDTINKKIKYKKIIFALLALVICGFIFTEFVKITLAAGEWKLYKSDFQWAISNTDENALFMAGGQCLSYYLNRQTLYPSEKNIAKLDYVWINQNFRLDKRSILDGNLLKIVEDNKLTIVYQNNRTKTTIYKIK